MMTQEPNPMIGEEKSRHFSKAMRSVLERRSGLLIVLLANAFLVFYAVFLYVKLGSINAVRDYMGGKKLLVVSKIALLGTVREGGKLNVDFDLVNASSGPVRIIGAGSGCYCTVPNSIPFVIEAGKKKKLTFGLNLKGIPPGQFKSEIVLYTNIEGQHELMLEIEGLIAK